MQKILLFLSLILFTLNAFSQQFKGKVVDQNKQPIPMAEVVRVASNKHCHSNIQGNFTLDNVAIGDSIQVNGIGFESYSFAIARLDQPRIITLQPKQLLIGEVIVEPRRSTSGILSKLDLQVAPVNNAQQVLRKIPGLVIGQHAGGGKAEQIFLRGFDIDHGTDIRLTVDGIPVNMVSHAHGQGYSDLHFIIPELIEAIDYGKGPHNAEQGDFATAGYVDFRTKSFMDQSTIKIEGGQFDTFRLFGGINLVNNDDHKAFIATELISTDGPFESSQNFHRTNVLAKYSNTRNKNSRFSLTASHFDSRWDASGQIPQRAVDAGLISRFGAIDDTEGGSTSRTNIILNHEQDITSSSQIRTTAFYSQYEFELFSNFTFFLNNPEDGDQIRQYEFRDLYGLNSTYINDFSIGKFDALWKWGISVRNDISRDNELSRTKNREEVLEFIQKGTINQLNAATFSDLELTYKKWTIRPGVRLDRFDFQYENDLETEYSVQSETEYFVSPKLSVHHHFNENLEVFGKSGVGFHSNDSRVVILENPSSSIPLAFGNDIGIVAKPFKPLYLSATFWHLYMEQEFVYVGDEGIVEPSGETYRRGVEVNLTYQPFSWMYLNADVNYTIAEALNEPEGQDYIPLAPDLVATGSLQIKNKKGLSAGLYVRYLDDRPANEDNSIVAEGYTVVDASIAQKWDHFGIQIQVQNLLDVDWNETQFATESRLMNEVESVEEIHFTPGTPFFLQMGVQYNF